MSLKNLQDDLFNILTDADSIQTSRGTQQALSDTSSDSGCNFEQQLLSPEPCSSSANSNGLDLLRYMQEDDEEYETPVHVNPRTNSPEYDSEEIITTLPSSFETGATTIFLPVISPVSVKTVNILTPSLYCMGPKVSEPKKWLVPNFIFKGWEWCI